MRRNKLLEIADCEAERFNSMRRRDQLPFLRMVAPTEDGTKWGEFTLHEAFVLRLMLDLIDEGGVGIDPARAIIMTAVNPTNMPTHPLQAAADAPDIWAAGVWLKDDDETEPFRFHIFGVTGHFSELEAKMHDLRNTYCGGKEPVRVVAVNASRAARFVWAKALERSVAIDVGSTGADWREFSRGDA